MLLRDSDIDSSIHIDFVPMADVLFNLLIFFLLATTIAQVEREMNIALPFAQSSTPISTALRELVINIDQQGRVFTGGQEVTLDQLRGTISELTKINPDQKVSVRGDRATAYMNVVRVLDVCKAAGVQEPYLDTVLE